MPRKNEPIAGTSLGVLLPVVAGLMAVPLWIGITYSVKPVRAVVRSLLKNHFMTSASMHRVTRYATSHCVVLETKNAERQRHANVEPDRVADDRRHMAWPLSVGGGAKTFGLL
jgi:hypothetical protein